MHEGPLVYFTLRPVGALFFAGLIAYLVNPSVMRWAFLPLPGKVRALGVAAAKRQSAIPDVPTGK